MAQLELLSEAQQDAFTDSCFAAWMRKVDAVIARKIGLTSADLSDICYRDLFEDGASPAEAAAEALENEGFEG